MCGVCGGACVSTAAVMKFVPKPSYEEKIDERRRMPKLVDCSLPEGMTLVTPTPKQAVVSGLCVWVFILRFECVVNGSVERYTHAARYESILPEDVQMRWAIGDFTKALEREGIVVGEVSLLGEEVLPKATCGQKVRNYQRSNYKPRVQGSRADQAWNGMRSMMVH